VKECGSDPCGKHWRRQRSAGLEIAPEEVGVSPARHAEICCSFGGRDQNARATLEVPRAKAGAFRGLALMTRRRASSSRAFAKDLKQGFALRGEIRVQAKRRAAPSPDRGLECVRRAMADILAKIEAYKREK